MSNIARIQSGQLSTTKYGKVSAEQMLTGAFESLSKRAIKAVGPTGEPMNVPVAWPHGQCPSSEERAGLSKIVSAIHLAMQMPATDDQMATLFSDLFHSRSLYGADISGKVRVYSMVLEEVPFAILNLAIGLIIRGKAEGIGKDLPGTDVLLAYCERLQRDVMAKAVMVERMLALPEQGPPLPPPSPEEVEANRQRLRATFTPRRLDTEAE